MTQTASTNIPAWKVRWNEIRNIEIQKARAMAEESAKRDIADANVIIFQLLHDSIEPAIRMTDEAFAVFGFDEKGDKHPWMRYNFHGISALCPEAKAEFIRIYHILLTREYGEEIEIGEKLFKLKPDPFISEYTPA